MLKNEEAKAMKKIQETRRKAEEIMRLREENDRKFEQKIKKEMRMKRNLSNAQNQKYQDGKDR